MIRNALSTVRLDISYRDAAAKFRIIKSTLCENMHAVLEQPRVRNSITTTEEGFA